MKDTNSLLQDMLQAIASIESHSVSSFEAFQEDHKTQDAIMYNLIILGEAAHNIPGEYQENHPEIPWSAIIGTRNIIVHGYDQVRTHIVWDIIQKNLQVLKINLLQLV
jgi:uncharacterized protein with HEPN domain